MNDDSKMELAQQVWEAVSTLRQANTVLASAKLDRAIELAGEVAIELEQ